MFDFCTVKLIIFSEIGKYFSPYLTFALEVPFATRQSKVCGHVLYPTKAGIEPAVPAHLLGGFGFRLCTSFAFPLGGFGVVLGLELLVGVVPTHPLLVLLTAILGVSAQLGLFGGSCFLGAFLARGLAATIAPVDVELSDREQPPASGAVFLPLLWR